MDTEFETKVLDIDVSSVVAKLIAAGAKEVPEALMRRYVFDYDAADVEFLRLREFNGRATLTYKFKPKNNTTIGITSEIEVEVSSFDKTAEILKKLVFKRIFYQENKRHMFTLNEIEYSIDTWPRLKPLLEIEAKNKEKLMEGLQLLNLERKDIGDKDMKNIYRDNGIDLHSIKELKF